jgi:hypothetical protein
MHQSKTNILCKEIDVPELSWVIGAESFVYGLDGFHILVIQLEVKDVVVLLQSL